MAGLAVGVVIMAYLSMRASKTFVDVFRSNYLSEQDDLAAAAHARGDKYAEFIYRHNIVDTYNCGGTLTVFGTMKKAWSYGFPFAAPILDRIVNPPGIEKGRQIGYATELGRLAEATENVGLRAEAEKLWIESARLIGHNDVHRMRKFVAGLHDIDEKYKSNKDTAK